MKHNTLGTNGVLIFVSLVWGLGFIPQRLGLESLEPMGFNALRFLFGAMALIPIVYFISKARADLLCARTVQQSAILGLLLAAAAGFQQVSIGLTSIANVAFITGFYVIFVPIIGFSLGYRYRLLTWIGGVMALFGLALLSGFDGHLSLNGDMVALIGAVFWAVHLMAITRFVQTSNAYALAFYQFVFCAGFSLVYNLMFEAHLFPLENSGYLWAGINGFIVVGIAYTLQVAILENADPFIASLIFSLESVFGALAGYWVFEEILELNGLLGAAFMFMGCILAQLPNKRPLPSTGTAG